MHLAGRRGGPARVADLRYSNCEGLGLQQCPTILPKPSSLDRLPAESSKGLHPGRLLRFMHASALHPCQLPPATQKLLCSHGFVNSTHPCLAPQSQRLHTIAAFFPCPHRLPSEFVSSMSKVLRPGRLLRFSIRPGGLLFSPTDGRPVGAGGCGSGVSCLRKAAVLHCTVVELLRLH